MLLADSPGALLDRNFLRLNLNEPCALADTAWIKPGKVIREVTPTTAGGLACVDFAVKHKLQYVEFDAGWYGPENQATDASRVQVDPARSPGPLDLQQVIDYGASNGVGVILYVNKLALGQQIDSLPALYRSWGVKGLKFGFVNVGSQADTNRTLELPLSFLSPARDYLAHTYAHDPALTTRTRVRIERFRVDASPVLQLPLTASSGQAIQLTPVAR